MKVAVLTPWEHRCGNAEYAKKLVKGFPENVEIVPIDLPNLTGTGKGLMYKKFLRAHFKSILMRIKEINPDVVHIQHEFVFFAHGIARSCGILNWVVNRINYPIVYTLHTVPPKLLLPDKRKILRRFDPRRIIAARYYLNALSRSENIIVHNEDAKRTLVEARPSLHSKIIVLPPPINAPNPSIPGSYTKSAEDKWIVMLGFISEYKGHLSALRVLSFLPNNYKLIVAGGRHPKDLGFTSYWSRILALIDSLGLQGRVKFTGFLSTDNEQAHYLENADAFFMPYMEVGQSGSAVLADVMAYDAPIVTSNAISMQTYRQHSDTIHSALTLFDAKTINATSEDDAYFARLADKVLRVIDVNDAEVSILNEHRKVAKQRFSSTIIGSEHARIYSNAKSGKKTLSKQFDSKEI